MNFKTKYRLQWNQVDNFQAVQQNDQPSISGGNDGTSDQNSNKPVGANYVPGKIQQLSGKGSNGEYNEIEEIDEKHTEIQVQDEHRLWREVDSLDAYDECVSLYGIKPKYKHRRLFKKDGIIYDLTH